MQTSAQLIRRAGADGSLATDRTISESVRKWASERGDGLAFVGPDSTLTWRQLDLAADECAAWLAAAGGHWRQRGVARAQQPRLRDRLPRHAAAAGSSGRWELATDRRRAGGDAGTRAVGDRRCRSPRGRTAARPRSGRGPRRGPQGPGTAPRRRRRTARPSRRRRRGRAVLVHLRSTGVPKAVGLSADRIELAVALRSGTG